MKGEDGSELFEDGVLLARQYLGVGEWHVWDLRPGSAKHCQQCSSVAERIVRHELGRRCPGAGPCLDRVPLAREAIARRSAETNEREINAVLIRARELDLEAAANEGDAVCEEVEGDDEQAPGPDEAETEAEAGAEEAEISEAEVSAVFHLFNYSFSNTCPVFRSGSPLFRPRRPHRPHRPPPPLSRRTSQATPMTVRRWRPFTRGFLTITERQTLARILTKQPLGTASLNRLSPRWLQRVQASVRAGQTSE